MLSHNPGDVAGVFGVTRSGKTEWMKREVLMKLVLAQRRVIALDCKRELSVKGRPRLNTQVGPLPYEWTASQVAMQPRILQRPGLQLAVVPDQLMEPRSCARAFALVARLLRSFWDEGQDLRTTFVLEETQLWEKYERELLEAVATGWGDFGVDLVIVSQRANGVPIDARSQCTTIISFEQTEPADIEALRLRCSLTDPTFHERVSRLPHRGHQYELWRAGVTKHVEEKPQERRPDVGPVHDEQRSEVRSGGSPDAVRPGENPRSEEQHRPEGEGHVGVQGRRVLQHHSEEDGVAAPPKADAPSDVTAPPAATSDAPSDMPPVVPRRPRKQRKPRAAAAAPPQPPPPTSKPKRRRAA